MFAGWSLQFDWLVFTPEHALDQKFGHSFVLSCFQSLAVCTRPRALNISMCNSLQVQLRNYMESFVISCLKVCLYEKEPCDSECVNSSPITLLD